MQLKLEAILLHRPLFIPPLLLHHHSGDGLLLVSDRLRQVGGHLHVCLERPLGILKALAKAVDF